MTKKIRPGDYFFDSKFGQVIRVFAYQNRELVIVFPFPKDDMSLGWALEVKALDTMTEVPEEQIAWYLLKCQK